MSLASAQTRTRLALANLLFAQGHRHVSAEIRLRFIARSACALRTGRQAACGPLNHGLLPQAFGCELFEPLSY